MLSMQFEDKNEFDMSRKLYNNELITQIFKLQTFYIFIIAHTC